MLWSCGFPVTFLLGGMSGVFIASPPLDFHLTDSYFIVAHLHYVLFGMVVFAMFAGFHSWWPKFTGKLLDERLGKVHFWTLFVVIRDHVPRPALARRAGHAPPLRRVPGRGRLHHAEHLSSVGAFLLGLSTLPFLYNGWRTHQYGTRVEHDAPCGYGRSLDRTTRCPPLRHNLTSLPRIRSESPAGEDLAQQERPALGQALAQQPAALGDEAARRPR